MTLTIIKEPHYKTIIDYFCAIIVNVRIELFDSAVEVYVDRNNSSQVKLSSVCRELVSKKTSTSSIGEWRTKLNWTTFIYKNVV